LWDKRLLLPTSLVLVSTFSWEKSSTQQQMARATSLGDLYRSGDYKPLYPVLFVSPDDGTSMWSEEFLDDRLTPPLSTEFVLCPSRHSIAAFCKHMMSA